MVERTRASRRAFSTPTSTVCDSSRRVLVVLVAASVAVGCRTKDKDAGREPTDDVSFVEEGTDTSAAETDVQLLTSSLVSTSAGTIGLASADLTDTNLGPRDIGDGALAIYFPRDCLAVSPPVDQTVTYTFTRCMGPNGLRVISGQVKVRYRTDANVLHLDLVGTDLSVNNASLDWAATADIAAEGPARTMTWKAQLSGTSAGGRPFSRTNEHTVSWTVGEPCFALEGFSEGQIKGRSIRTEISNFRRCRHGCPDAGGTIAITHVTKNKRFELHYDGSNRATFVGPKGEVSVTLLCTP